MPPKTKLTPLKAIRLKCLECCLGQAQEVRLCPVKECNLHPYRFGRQPKVKTGELLPTLKVIRGKCLDCSAHNTSRVRECPIQDCILHSYRLGKKPNRAGIGGKPSSNRGKASPGEPKDAQDGDDRPRIVA